MQFFSKEAFNFKAQIKNFKKVQNIAICGLFIALYIILSYMNIKISAIIEIRFTFLVLALAGFYGGPLMGMTVGAASDILSMLMTAGQGSTFFFGFTFSYALMGFLFGVVLYKSKITIPRTIATSAVEGLISITLHTLWLNMLYGTPLPVLLSTRGVKQAVMFPINAVLLYVVFRAFSLVAVHAGIFQNREN